MGCEKDSYRLFMIVRPFLHHQRRKNNNLQQPHATLHDLQAANLMSLALEPGWLESRDQVPRGLLDKLRVC